MICVATRAHVFGTSLALNNDPCFMEARRVASLEAESVRRCIRETIGASCQRGARSGRSIPSQPVSREAKIGQGTHSGTTTGEGVPSPLPEATD